MTPEKASCRDHSQIVSLIPKVAELSIIPNLNREGKSYFLSRIVPDLKQVMSNDSYGIYKIQDEHNLIGIGAIRDDDYITHLFIDTRYQGTGLGKTLLRHLLKDTTGPVRLRSSIIHRVLLRLVVKKASMGCVTCECSVRVDPEVSTMSSATDVRRYPDKTSA